MNSIDIAIKAIRNHVSPKSPIKPIDMTHNCIGNGCRHVGCENQLEQPKRKTSK